jgi:shikimate dehydrogenase
MRPWSDGWRPEGSTRVAAIIGDPVRHSRSPTIHNAAFAALGLDWVFVTMPVAAGGVPAALAGMRALQIDGLSVTMPHKTAVVEAVDELTADARSLGAVNHVSRRGDRLIGDNTDGAGFIDGLRTDTGFAADGQRCVVVGAGGAARAVVLALARAGASEVVVVNRSAEGAQVAASLAASVGRVGGLEAIGAAALVVNATSVGMARDGAEAPTEVPFDPDLLQPGQVVVDLIYQPLVTPLLRAAAGAGLATTNGVSMLVHQAALQFTNWTGELAPLETMVDAVVRALAVRAATDAAGGI